VNPLVIDSGIDYCLDHFGGSVPSAPIAGLVNRRSSAMLRPAPRPGPTCGLCFEHPVGGVFASPETCSDVGCCVVAWARSEIQRVLDVMLLASSDGALFRQPAIRVYGFGPSLASVRRQLSDFSAECWTCAAWMWLSWPCDATSPPPPLRAEAAGHNAATVLDQALGQRTLDDVRSPARALTWRIRRLGERHARSPRAEAARATPVQPAAAAPPPQPPSARRR
jgi:hypothetical protein